MFWQYEESLAGFASLAHRDSRLLHHLRWSGWDWTTSSTTMTSKAEAITVSLEHTCLTRSVTGRRPSKAAAKYPALPSHGPCSGRRSGDDSRGRYSVPDRWGKQLTALSPWHTSRERWPSLAAGGHTAWKQRVIGVRVNQARGWHPQHRPRVLECPGSVTGRLYGYR